MSDFTMIEDAAKQLIEANREHLPIGAAGLSVVKSEGTLTAYWQGPDPKVWGIVKIDPQGKVERTTWSPSASGAKTVTRHVPVE